MNPTLWKRVEAVLDRALELAPEARKCFLDEACAGDAAVRGEVEGLLRWERAANDVLREPMLQYASALLSASEEEDTWIGTEIAGRYQVEAELGRGGMGVVYRARDTKLGKPVAVKRIPPERLPLPEARRRFEREVRLACRVEHASVARVLDTGDHEGSTYLVMEYVDGQPLGSQPKRRGTEEIFDLAIQVTKALVAIHAQGLVHRDLKPGNILVTADGYVKVVDFGVALELLSLDPRPTDGSTASVAAGATQMGAHAGTPEYMSPEQIQEGRVDARSDLFSLGIVLCELIAGVHPFRKSSRGETTAAILKETPCSESLSVTGALSPILLRLLRKDPQERYQTARALLADLESARNDRLDAAKKPSVVSKALLLAVALGLVAAGGWWGWQLLAPPLADDRPLVAVMPFEDRTGEADGPLTARMFSDLLSADLGESTRLRVMDPERVASLLGVSVAGIGGDALSRHSTARYEIRGRLYRVRDLYEASVEVHDLRRGDALGSARVSAGGTTALVDLAKLHVLSAMFPTAASEEPDDPAAATLASASDEARKLEFEGREALREYRLGDAVSAFEQALALDTGFLSARIGLAEALEIAGYAGRAREQASLAVRLIEGGLVDATTRMDHQVRAIDARIGNQTAAEIRHQRALVELRPGEIGPLLALVRALLDRGEHLEEALAFTQRAVDLDPKDPRTHLRRAQVLGALGSTEPALALLERAETLYANLRHSQGIAEVRITRGSLLYNAHRFEEAAKSYEAARTAFAEVGLDVRAARADKSVGDMDLMLGRFEQADLRYRRSAAVAETHGNRAFAVEIRDAMGASSIYQRKMHAAEPLLRSAVAEARTLDNPRLLATPLLNLASLLIDTHRTGEGTLLARESVELARATTDRHFELQSLKLLGSAAMTDGDFPQARTYLNHVIEVDRSSPAPRLHLAYALIVTAESFDVQGELGAALRSIEEAIADSRSTSDANLLTYALTVRAQLWAELGQPVRAQADLDEAEALNTSAGLAYQPRILIARVQNALMNENLGHAKSLLASAREAATRHEASIELAQVYLLQCEIAVLEKDRELATETCASALATGPLPLAQRIAAEGFQSAAQLRGAAIEPARAKVRAAFTRAEQLDLRLTTAQLAMAAAELSSDGDLLLTAARALRDYIDSAPQEYRSTLTARSDLRPLIQRMETMRGDSL